MDKQEIIQSIITNLNSIANSLETLVSTNIPVHEADKDVKATVIPLETVRAVLAEKSRSGKTAEVRELLIKFGANRLSEINPDCYEELLRAAEEL